MDEFKLHIKHLIDANSGFMDHLRSTHLYLKSNGIEGTIQWIKEHKGEDLILACQAACIFFERLNAWNQLIHIVEYGLKHVPHHPALSLILTHAFIQIGQYEDAQDILHFYLKRYDQHHTLWEYGQLLFNEIETNLNDHADESTQDLSGSWRGPTLLNQVSPLFEFPEDPTEALERQISPPQKPSLYSLSSLDPDEEQNSTLRETSSDPFQSTSDSVTASSSLFQDSSTSSSSFTQNDDTQSESPQIPRTHSEQHYSNEQETDKKRSENELYDRNLPHLDQPTQDFAQSELYTLNLIENKKALNQKDQKQTHKNSQLPLEDQPTVEDSIDHPAPNTMNETPMDSVSESNPTSTSHNLFAFEQDFSAIDLDFTYEQPLPQLSDFNLSLPSEATKESLILDPNQVPTKPLVLSSIQNEIAQVEGYESSPKTKVHPSTSNTSSSEDQSSSHPSYSSLHDSTFEEGEEPDDLETMIDIQFNGHPALFDHDTTNSQQTKENPLP